mmetsp:Transcript_104940/g.306509  ORF Transcript_104940/g.306509 Transcript_104940/m.306509 type:complete len:208 (-) Transcript_104940:46-669(-)
MDGTEHGGQALRLQCCEQPVPHGVECRLLQARVGAHNAEDNIGTFCNIHDCHDIPWWIHKQHARPACARTLLGPRRQHSRGGHMRRDRTDGIGLRTAAHEDAPFERKGICTRVKGYQCHHLRGRWPTLLVRTQPSTFQQLLTLRLAHLPQSIQAVLLAECPSVDLLDGGSGCLNSALGLVSLWWLWLLVLLRRPMVEHWCHPKSQKK